MHFKRYVTFGPDAEVLGRAMLAFVRSINFAELKRILEQHELVEIEPERWYPQQIWLDVFNDLAANPNSSLNMVSVGMKIAETAMPDLTGPVDFVTLMREFGQLSYAAHNRGADIGGIETEVINDHYLIMYDRTPYPDDFVYGAYYGMAKRFLPKGTQFTIRFDENRRRREEGGSVTVVHIAW